MFSNDQRITFHDNRFIDTPYFLQRKGLLHLYILKIGIDLHIILRFDFV